MDDDLLWGSFLDGSRSAFQEIYSKFYQNLYSYGMRKLNHAELVRDCIQDLFITLWTNRNNLSRTTNIKFYLLASLRNQLIKVAAADGKWQKVEISSTDDFRIQFNPELEYLRKENLTQKAKILIEALDKLTARQKEVLYLRYFEELNYEQIADLLNLTVKGVYKLNYRAIDAMKLILNINKSELLLLFIACKFELFK